MADQFELEIAIEEPGHAAQLMDLGVHRIELCSNLAEGGLTPSAAQIEMTVDVSDLPVYVMLRPRAGDFIYNRLEKHMMLEELKILSDCGATGIVFGALDGGRNVDAEFVELVAQFAQDYGLAMTFHRAFDACVRPETAMELLVELGVERILTSGFAPTVAGGLPALKDLVEQAAGRIQIQAGSGVSAEVVDDLWTAGIRSYHCTARVKIPARPGTVEEKLGFGDYWSLDRKKIEDLNNALWRKLA
jgi:copper homeostasis protein